MFKIFVYNIFIWRQVSYVILSTKVQIFEFFEIEFNSVDNLYWISLEGLFKSTW